MKNKILFISYLLFGLMFINAGLNKFFNYMPAPDNLPENMMKMMKAFTDIFWLMPLVAVVEIIGGLLFIIPRFRALGAIIILPIMLGVLLINILVMPSALPLTLILTAILLWAMIDNLEKYLPLFKE